MVPSFGKAISRPLGITGGPVTSGTVTVTLPVGLGLAGAEDAGGADDAGGLDAGGLEAGGVVPPPPQAVSATSIVTTPSTISFLPRLIAVFFTAILL